MFNGYNGKVLFIDLSSGSIKEERLPEKVYHEFIGGLGVGVRVLYECMKPKAEPLGPDNILGFVTSPLTGTGFQGARLQLVGKSPLTGGWGDANCGGSLAVELKASGYDGVFFGGVSPKPVYVYLNDGEVEFIDAVHLWGKDTVETEERIKDELGMRTRVACIGPAGESMSLSAGVAHEGSSFAARSGLGAVMGAKRLKAFAARGTKRVPVADGERLAMLHRRYIKDVKESTNFVIPMFRKWGTCSFFEDYLAAGDCPIKNWTLSGKQEFTNWANLHGDSITKYEYRKHACRGCSLGCKGWLAVDKGPFAVSKAAKVEYETLGMLGSNLLIDDIEAIIKANDICNRGGMDTISVGSALSLAMECYEHGLITKEDTGGIELTWGNANSMVAMVEKIVRRQRFGAVLADGSKLAAERIGRGSEKWAMHVGGQDLPAHDPRTSIAHGWGYITDPTPGRHTTTQIMDSYEEQIPLSFIAELEFPQKVNMLDPEANIRVFAVSSDLDQLTTSAGVCWFGMVTETLPLIDVISAMTGWDFSLVEGLKVGRRIKTLRQAFNFREGVKPGEWHIPERLEAAPVTGPIAGRKVDFKAMKKIGYGALGWDHETGKPLKLTLEELGLTELVGQLP